jgi:hypothetical protein
MTSLKPQTIANFLRDGDLSFAGYGAHGYVVHALYIVSDSLLTVKEPRHNPRFSVLAQGLDFRKHSDLNSMRAPFVETQKGERIQWL